MLRVNWIFNKDQKTISTAIYLLLWENQEVPRNRILRHSDWREPDLWDPISFQNKTHSKNSSTQLTLEENPFQKEMKNLFSASRVIRILLFPMPLRTSSVLPRLSRKKLSGPRKRISVKPQSISRPSSQILRVSIKWSKIYTWMRPKNKKDKSTWCHPQRSDNSWMVSRPSGRLSIRSTKISLISEWLILLVSRERRSLVRRSSSNLKRILKNLIRLTFSLIPPDDSILSICSKSSFFYFFKIILVTSKIPQPFILSNKRDIER